MKSRDRWRKSDYTLLKALEVWLLKNNKFCNCLFNYEKKLKMYIFTYMIFTLFYINLATYALGNASNFYIGLKKYIFCKLL